MIITNWLIEDGVFASEQYLLTSTLEDLSIPYKLLSKEHISESLVAPNTFLYGSVDLITKYMPGSIEALSVSNQVRELSLCKGSHFYFNHDFVVTTLGEIVSNKEYYINKLGRRVFIKPNIGKDFDGDIFDLQYLESEDFCRANSSLLVAIGAVKTVAREWRLVIVNEKIVASSLYYTSQQWDSQEGAPQQVLDFTSNVLSKVGWRPSSSFTLDVFEVDDSLYVGELNSINCSCFYACDLYNVVASITYG